MERYENFRLRKVLLLQYLAFWHVFMSHDATVHWTQISIHLSFTAWHAFHHELVNKRLGVFSLLLVECTRENKLAMMQRWHWLNQAMNVSVVLAERRNVPVVLLHPYRLENPVVLDDLFSPVCKWDEEDCCLPPDIYHRFYRICCAVSIMCWVYHVCRSAISECLANHIWQNTQDTLDPECAQYSCICPPISRMAVYRVSPFHLDCPSSRDLPCYPFA